MGKKWKPEWNTVHKGTVGCPGTYRHQKSAQEHIDARMVPGHMGTGMVTGRVPGHIYEYIETEG